MKFFATFLSLFFLTTLVLSGCTQQIVSNTKIKDEELPKYYSNLEASYLNRGYLKGDDKSDVISFNADMLASNFEDIALYDEYIVRNGRFISKTTPSKLRKWIQPIRVKVIHGSSVPFSRRYNDFNNIQKYLARLSALIDHPIELTDQNPNFFILVMSAKEYRYSKELIQTEIGNAPKPVLDAIQDSSPRVLCSAFTVTKNRRSSELTRAVVVLKDEQRGIMRESCVHEEIAQAMGLVNDSFKARPSIFNDDEEFAFLTRHDELLLKILYDPRIKIGMEVEEARPIIREIARGLIEANLIATN